MANLSLTIELIPKELNQHIAGLSVILQVIVMFFFNLSFILTNTVSIKKYFFNPLLTYLSPSIAAFICALLLDIDISHRNLTYQIVLNNFILCAIPAVILTTVNLYRNKKKN